jgi:hypothetical protein
MGGDQVTLVVLRYGILRDDVRLVKGIVIIISAVEGGRYRYAPQRVMACVARCGFDPSDR